MKIAVLWTQLSGYLNACLKELASREGIEIFVAHQAPTDCAPFDEEQFGWIGNRLTWHSSCDPGLLEMRLRAFEPDILVICSWHVPAYRAAAKTFANESWRVMVMDNCWLGTLKQRVGTLIAPFYLHPLVDAVWLPGERQEVFARKLGFDSKSIIHGSLSCDKEAIESVFIQRINRARPVPHSFLFLGRFVAEKGLDTLVEAYAAYRETNSNPWPLVCCGTGPLQPCLEGKAGIRVEGFVQPERLPSILASAGCLIIPSKFEPWALVVNEAATAGLPILASQKVGSAVHLVQSGYNGFTFDCGDVAGLASLMGGITSMSDEQLDAMSRASHLLSQQFSPSRWANALLDSYKARLRNREHAVCTGASQ